MAVIKFTSMQARILSLFAFLVLIRANPDSNVNTDISDATDPAVRGNNEPEIKFFDAKFVMVDKIYAEWEIDKHNASISCLSILYKNNDAEAQISEIPSCIHSDISYYIGNGTDFKKGVKYQFGIRVKGQFGKDNRTDKFDDKMQTPLTKDFVPTPEISEADIDSRTITWDTPPHDLDRYYYYQVNQTEGVEKTDAKIYRNITRGGSISPLKPDIDYQFRVRFCIKKAEMCGDWGTEVHSFRSVSETGNSTSATESPTDSTNSLNPLNFVNLVLITAFSLFCSTY